MLTIKKISGSQAAAAYYAEYAQEKGESQGYWANHSDQQLQDGAAVEPQAMLNLLRGYSPDGKAALCQNPGEGHQPGWDLTFSPPKSVSIAWSNAEEGTRHEIELAHTNAVALALKFINDEATFVRMGKGGASVQPARLLAALFQHSSNRAEEPQLHTHAIVFNVAQTIADGKWRTLHPYPIYRAYMAAGALYKAELAHQMRGLGFATHRTKDSFELTQVPEAVCNAQSSRSKAIEAALESKGLTRSSASAVTKELIALDTRSEKGGERIVRDFPRWQNENSSFGFGPKEMAAIVEPEVSHPQPMAFNKQKQHEVMSECLQKLTARASTFNTFELYRAAAEAAITEIDAAAALVIARAAKASSEVVALGPNRHNEERFSTQEMTRIEQENMDIAASRRGEGKHPVPESQITQVLAQRLTMTEEQSEALRHVANGADGVAFIEGDAGTGKSFLMAAVRESYEGCGYEVRGISFTNKAAQNLQEGSGIKNCQSVDSFLIAQRNGQEQVHRRTVLVLDEAGMLDSRKMRELMGLCQDHGTKLVCVGDQKQIQPIAAGQAFGSMKREFGAKRLSEIMRQKDDWLRSAIKDFAEGRARLGIDQLDSQGALQLAKNRGEARQAIVSEWNQQTSVLGLPKAPLMVVTTNTEVTHLNFLAREQLVKNGILDQGTVIQTDHGSHCFSSGDRIVFTANFKKKGILNSGIATIERVKRSPITSGSKTLTVSLENGRRVKFDPKNFKSFRHAYAITAHKSQGATVDRVLVLVDGPLMDREKFYVAISRGRERPVAFADQQTLGELPAEEKRRLATLSPDERGKDEREFFKASLGRLLGASHEKDTTQDYPGTQVEPSPDFNSKDGGANKAWDSIKWSVFNQLRILHARLNAAFGSRAHETKSLGGIEQSVESGGKDVSFER
jgi:Ti-type conjugative transfer relaxase TraA